MPRPKGQPKIGGRKKGTPNKVAKDLRERIRLFLEEKWPEAVETWESIDKPGEKLRLYIDLSRFVLPVLQSVSLDATVKKEDNAEDDLRELGEEL